MGAPSRPARDRMTAASRLRPLPTRIPASAAILPEACTVRSTMHGVDNLTDRNTVRLARSAMCGRSGVPVLPFPAPSARNPACPRNPCPRGLPFFISTTKLKRGVIMAENTRSPSILR